MSAFSSFPGVGDCELCSNLIPALLRVPSSQVIGTIDSLIMRSNLPCRTCSIILLEIQDSYIMGHRRSEDEVLSGQTFLKLEVKDANTPVKISILTEHAGTELGKLELGLEDPGLPLLPPMFPHEMAPEKFLQRPTWSPSNTSAFPALTKLWTGAYIAAWLSACKRDHGETCNKSFGSEKPTRLLYIQEDGTLKLVLTEDLPVDEVAAISYATLSHVWGSSVHLKLLTSNIKSF